MLLGKDIFEEWGYFYDNLLPQEYLKILLMDADINELEIISSVCVRGMIYNFIWDSLPVTISME